MKKRNLYAIIALVAFSCVLITMNSFNSPAPAKNLGLQLYSVRDSIKKDVPGTIKKVGAMGYNLLSRPVMPMVNSME